MVDAEQCAAHVPAVLGETFGPLIVRGQETLWSGDSVVVRVIGASGLSVRPGGHLGLVGHLISMPVK